MADVYVDSSATGADDGTSKTDAYPSMSAALTGEGDGQRYLLSHTHQENPGAALTLTFSADRANPDQLVSIDYSDDSFTQGALINADASAALTIDGNFKSSGVNFTAGSGGASSSIQLRINTADDAEQEYDNCTLYLNSSSANSYTLVGADSTTTEGAKVKFGEGVVYRKGNAGQWWYLRDAIINMSGFSVHASSSGGSTSGEFRGLSDLTILNIDDSDFTNFGTSWDIYNKVNGSLRIFMNRCLMASGWNGDLSSDGVADMFPADLIRMINCGDEDVNHGYDSAENAGEITDQVDLYASGTTGAEYNSADIPISYKMVSSANCSFVSQKLESPIIAKYNTDTTEQTVTLEFIHNEAALLQDDEIWMELSYLGDSGSQKGTVTNDGMADPMATAANQETSTKAWDEGLTERADSTAYSVGDFCKSSVSAAGVAFICTASTGNSAASIPAGFTNATDGDSITDGNVTWEAMYRQKCSVTVTAAEKGFLLGKLILADPSVTLWVANRLT